MLKIGDFSKLSRVSIRMLRYYDEIGLLKPAETDRFTDYRYYSESQLPTVCRITALRDMGFKLAEVSAILAEYDDPAALERRLSALRAHVRHLSCQPPRDQRPQPVRHRGLLSGEEEVSASPLPGTPVRKGPPPAGGGSLCFV